jgi:hypothetical protein
MSLMPYFCFVLFSFILSCAKKLAFSQISLTTLAIEFKEFKNQIRARKSFSKASWKLYTLFVFYFLGGFETF